MSSDGLDLNMSDSFGLQRPGFHIGQHESSRQAPLNDLQYGQLLNHGVSRYNRIIQQMALTKN